MNTVAKVPLGGWGWLCLCQGVEVFGVRAGSNVGTIDVDAVEADIVDAGS